MQDSSEEDGDKPALPPQRRISAQNMRQWAQHQQAEATIPNSRKEAQEAPPYAAHTSAKDDMNSILSNDMPDNDPEKQRHFK